MKYERQFCDISKKLEKSDKIFIIYRYYVYIMPIKR